MNGNYIPFFGKKFFKIHSDWGDKPVGPKLPG